MTTHTDYIKRTFKKDALAKNVVSDWNNSANLLDQGAISTPDKIGKSHNHARWQIAFRFSPERGNWN